MPILHAATRHQDHVEFNQAIKAKREARSRVEEAIRTLDGIPAATSARAALRDVFVNLSRDIEALEFCIRW